MSVEKWTFESPVVHWMAAISSLNCLSEIPCQSLRSLNALPSFSETGFYTPPPLEGKIATDTLTPLPAPVVYKISGPMGGVFLYTIGAEAENSAVNFSRQSVPSLYKNQSPTFIGKGAYFHWCLLRRTPSPNSAPTIFPIECCFPDLPPRFRCPIHGRALDSLKCDSSFWGRRVRGIAAIVCDMPQKHSHDDSATGVVRQTSCEGGSIWMLSAVPSRPRWHGSPTHIFVARPSSQEQPGYEDQSTGFGSGNS